MARKQSFGRDMVDRIVDRVVRGVINLLLAFPYERRLRLAGAAVRRIVGPVAGYRRRVLANLALIYPDMPLADRRRFAAASLDNLGRAIIETYDHDGFRARIRRSPVSGPGLAAIDAAAAEGRPVLFVTGHFGSHDAARFAMVERGHDVSAIYRPMKNRFFNRRYEMTLTGIGGTPYPQTRNGIVSFVRALSKGNWGTLMIDVWRHNGEPIDFLGHPAPTPLSAGEFALRCKALLVPYFAVRQPDGETFAITVEDPIPEGTPLEMVTEASRRLEAQIARHPEQWFWVHRRWKPARETRH